MGRCDRPGAPPFGGAGGGRRRHPRPLTPQKGETWGGGGPARGPDDPAVHGRIGRRRVGRVIDRLMGGARHSNGAGAARARGGPGVPPPLPDHLGRFFFGHCPPFSASLPCPPPRAPPRPRPPYLLLVGGGRHNNAGDPAGRAGGRGRAQGGGAGGEGALHGGKEVGGGANEKRRGEWEGGGQCSTPSFFFSLLSRRALIIVFTSGKASARARETLTLTLSLHTTSASLKSGRKEERGKGEEGGENATLPS